MTVNVAEPGVLRPAVQLVDRVCQHTELPVLRSTTVVLVVLVLVKVVLVTEALPSVLDYDDRRALHEAVVETRTERRDDFEYMQPTVVHHGAKGHNVRRFIYSEWLETAPPRTVTTRYFRSETRTILVYGSGVEVPGEWVAVPGTETMASRVLVNGLPWPR